MFGVGFDDLLQQAEQLTTGLDGGAELPRVQRNFQQLLDAGQRLCSKTTGGHDNAQIKASLLLSSQGADIPAIPDRLKALTSDSQSFEPLETVAETDIEGFLRNERENAILAVVEEQKQKTFAEVEKRHWESRLKEWEIEKQQILNKLIGNDGSLSFTQEVTDSSTKNYFSKTSALIANPRSSMEPWELSYVRQVHLYNDNIIKGSLPFNLAKLCKNAAKKMNDISLIALWKMVHSMTKVSALGRHSTINQTQRIQKPILESFIRQGRKYLEKSYIEYMKNCVYSRPHLAQRGGIPGTEQLVKSFLKIQPANLMQGYDDGEVDGFPIWAVIFYCLRCGDLKAVSDIVEQNEHLIPEFQGWFQEFIEDRRLSPASEQKMRIQYKRVVRSSTDPYKIAVYCIIARCDVTNVLSEVAQKAEDYLWLKLCQVVVEDKSLAPADTLTLKSLQTLLLVDYGESHFGASTNPLLYFQILFLTCQFEAAIEFLSRFESLRFHAVHIALALYTQGLLLTSSLLYDKMLTPSHNESPLRACLPPTPFICCFLFEAAVTNESIQLDHICRKVPFRMAQRISTQSTYRVSNSSPSAKKSTTSQLNIARLVMLYTRKFELTDPREALNYYYLLRDIRTEGQSLLTHCISEIVRETGEFEMLLGSLNSDGSRRPGVIDKYCDKDTSELIAKVAQDTESKGLHEDAVRLYDLCGNHNQTIILLNRLLCPVLSSSDEANPDRLRLKMLALSIAERYKNEAVETSQNLRSTFHLQLDIISFFDLYHANRIEQALDIMNELQLLPVSNEQVQAKVTAFKSYSDEIRQSIAGILLATMSLLVKKYQQQQNLIKSLATKSGDSVCVMARQQGRALITFAGMLPYHLPGDTTSRLVQSEVLMN